MHTAGNAATPPAEQRGAQGQVNMLLQLAKLGSGITMGELVSPRHAAASAASPAPPVMSPATDEEALGRGPSLAATKEAHLYGIERLLTRPRKEVVAFLGAGFLAPLGSTFGSWKGLLSEMVNRASADRLAEAEQLSRPAELLARAATSAELQRVAQVIEDTISGEEKNAMDKLAAELLKLPDVVYDARVSAEKLVEDLGEEKAKGIVQFRKRIAMMRLLPFKAIVTTNFSIFAKYDLKSCPNHKVFSLRENEKPGELVHQLSSPATREALRNLLRDDNVGSAEVEAGSSAVNIDDREVRLLKCLDTGCAPPLWDALDPPVFHAHGTLHRPVFTKLSYRELLHDGPSFMPFMRALLTTRTLLYMGFSFADEYHVELRSQCLALLGSKGAADVPLEGSPAASSSAAAAAPRAATAPAARPFAALSVASPKVVAGAEGKTGLPAPLGYAIMELPRKEGSEDLLETEEELLRYHRQHEGLGYLPFKSEPVAGNSANRSFDGADKILEQLVAKASLTWRLRESLQDGKHILFFDRPAPNNFARLAAQLSKLSFKGLKPEDEDAMIDLEKQRASYQVTFEKARIAAEAEFTAAKAKYDRVVAAGSIELGRFTAAGGKAPLDKFTVPPRKSEKWPLPNGGSIDCIFSREAFLEILQTKAQLRARPSAEGDFFVEGKDD
jgi:hypothetical protein